MKKKDFYIGCEFYTAVGKWRCTDVGTRSIVAIKLDKEDDSWYNGPPYAVEESVFDEYDFEGCDKEPLLDTAILQTTKNQFTEWQSKPDEEAYREL